MEILDDVHVIAAAAVAAGFASFWQCCFFLDLGWLCNALVLSTRLEKC